MRVRDTVSNAGYFDSGSKHTVFIKTPPNIAIFIGAVDGGGLAADHTKSDLSCDLLY